MTYFHFYKLIVRGIYLLIGLMCIGCAAPNVEISSKFPEPNVRKAPVSLSFYLSEELTNYTYSQKMGKRSEWKIDLGAAQRSMFTMLGKSVFENYSLAQSNKDYNTLDGVIEPNIAEIQFSIPKQTRTDYFEVWIRYHFKLYDKNANLIGEWDLPAYGKAKAQDYPSEGMALQAAGLSACRDAMAFFSLNFIRVPIIKSWIQAGKPSREVPSPVEASPETA